MEEKLPLKSGSVEHRPSLEGDESERKTPSQFSLTRATGHPFCLHNSWELSRHRSCEIFPQNGAAKDFKPAHAVVAADFSDGFAIVVNQGMRAGRHPGLEPLLKSRLRELLR